MPGEVGHPFFVFGTLKADQLGFRQIMDVVALVEPATARGFSLYVRDGLPGLLPNPGGSVQGELLHAIDGSWEELDHRIRIFEPDGERELYSRKEILVDLPGSGSTVRALTHRFRREQRGHPDYWDRDSWTLADDPLILFGFPQILQRLAVSARPAESLTASDDPAFWSAYLPALGDFLTLTGVLERCAALAVGSGSPTETMKEFGRLQEAVRAAAKAPRPTRPTVYSTRNLSSTRWTPETSWDFWYQVRSNAVHRGKSASQDAALVGSSARGLAIALHNFLVEVIPGIHDAWTWSSRGARPPRELVKLLSDAEGPLT